VLAITEFPAAVASSRRDQTLHAFLPTNVPSGALTPHMIRMPRAMKMGTPRSPVNCQKSW
jgi:hypothetical protein